MKKCDFLELRIEKDALIKIYAITGMKDQTTTFSGVFLGIFGAKIRISLINHRLPHTEIPYHRISKIEYIDSLPDSRPARYD
jgi:hypothetical protein